MENTFRQPDLPQREAARCQEDDPDGIGDAQVAGKRIQVEKAKLFLYFMGNTVLKM